MKKFILLSFILTLILACFSISYAGTFYDVLDTKYEGIVESLAFLDIVNGTSDHVFDVNKVVTRAELSKMLVTAHGYDKISEIVDVPASFKDVKSGSWYYDYVNVAAVYGLVKGYPDGKFYPDEEVTYSQAVAMILRSLGHNYIREDSEFGWDYNYIWRMRDLRLNEGIEAFRNDDGAKRGDVAVFIWNMLNATYWEVVEEEGTGLLTYSDSGKVLLDKAFEKEYQLVSGKKIKSFSAEAGDMYANIETFGVVELVDPLPIYAMGAKVNGVYSKKEKKLVCATYDIDCAIVDGRANELEEDGYRTKGVKDKYYFGGREEDYIFFAVRRNGADEAIDRAIILDLSNKIKVDTMKTEKGILTVNDGVLEIDTKNAILLDGKRIREWSKLAKKDEILAIKSGEIYMIVNEYKSEYDIKDEEKRQEKEDMLYYITHFSYANGNNYIGLSDGIKTRQCVCTAELKNFAVGDLVLVSMESSTVTKLAKATSKGYEDLDLGRELVLNYKTKDYLPGMIGKYIIEKDTKIYLVSKQYATNSNSVFEKTVIEEVPENELSYVDDEVINLIVTGNEAKAVYIERETNKFSAFYGIVRDVYIEKQKLMISVSPVDDPVTNYETTGTVNCEIGDMISYTLSGKNNETLKIKEVYHKSVIGFKGDYVVNTISGSEIALTNGETFDKKSATIELGGRIYKLGDYKVVASKVRQDEDGWRFASATFEELKNVKFAVSDRIAIDEIEGVIVIYSGYAE